MKAGSQQLGGSPVEVHRVEDRQSQTAAGPVPVRIYWPRAAGATDRLPIIIYFHGGGFVLGDVDSHDSSARYYCRHADAIVINVDYRRSPENKFPAAVDDAYGAVLWASEHAGELGGDAQRIAVAGDSAGGNLATVVCQMAKEKGRPAIAFQALLYPLVDMDASSPFASKDEFGNGEYFLSVDEMEWFSRQYLRDAAKEVKDFRASPILNPDLRGLPPAVIITAGCDPLRDEGKAYADRLIAAGVPVDYRCFDGTIHAFVSFRGAIPAGEDAIAFVTDRLRKALRT